MAYTLTYFVARHYCKFSMKLGVHRTFQPFSVFRSIAICCNRLWNWTNPVTWVEHHSTKLAAGSTMVRTVSRCLSPLWHGFNPSPAHMVSVANWHWDWVSSSTSVFPFLYHSARWSILIPSCAPTLFDCVTRWQKGIGYVYPKTEQDLPNYYFWNIFYHIYNVAVRNFVASLFHQVNAQYKNIRIFLSLKMAHLWWNMLKICV
jgi:hypothetical protein